MSTFHKPGITPTAWRGIGTGAALIIIAGIIAMICMAVISGIASMPVGAWGGAR